MASILNYLIPDTLAQVAKLEEQKRALAQQKFQTGMQQPQMFNTEEMPIANDTILRTGLWHALADPAIYRTDPHFSNSSGADAKPCHQHAD